MPDIRSVRPAAPILIGAAAPACRRSAGAAASAEAPTKPLTILRRVTVCLATMVSSRIVEFCLPSAFARSGTIPALPF